MDTNYKLYGIQLPLRPIYIVSQGSLGRKTAPMPNKRSKNFDDGLHHGGGGIFHEPYKYVNLAEVACWQIVFKSMHAVTFAFCDISQVGATPLSSAITLSQSLIFLAVWNAQVMNCMLFNWTDNPKKLPIPLKGSGHTSNNGSFDPPKSAPQTSSESVQPFLQGSWKWQTEWSDTLTDRPTTLLCL